MTCHCSECSTSDFKEYVSGNLPLCRVNRTLGQPLARL
ncbi:hypothetical protein X971_2082 [Agrobacterium tumefaciens LBA4213 (Ach5)]|nr:hypothetical protein X971_2082 [Agrobacterium tumefaciens LBA4213 (Ach5)]